MSRIELIERGVLVSRNTDRTADSDSAAAEWERDGWLPSLLYFRRSEPLVELPRPRTVEGGRERNAEPEPDAVTFVAPPQPAIKQPADTVAGVLLRRRSLRYYKSEHFLDIDSLHELALLTQRLLARRLPEALSGLSFHFLLYRVEGAKPGIYSMGSDGALHLERTGMFADQMVEILCGMEAPLTGDATLVISFNAGARQRSFPYERALRELYIDAGRISQWWILTLEQRGLGSLITPATNDPSLAALLSFPEGRYPLYTLTFGPKPAESS